VTNGLNLRSLS